MRRFRATILSVFSLTLLACGADPESPDRLDRHSIPIVGGQAATADENHGTVALLDAEANFCTGTLISDTVVLTAAHCLMNFDEDRGLFTTERSAEEIRVAVNTTSVVAADLKTYTGSKIITTAFNGDIHPDPGENPEGLGKADDVGLLVLNAPVTEQTPVSILPAAQNEAAIKAGAELLISGFGLSSADEANADNGVLYLAQVSVTKRNEFELLAGTEEPADSCPGDSGGPAYVENCEGLFVAGITSRGVENSTVLCGQGGIWTIAPAYEQWVLSQVPDLYQAAPADVGAAARCEAPEIDEGGCSMSPTSRRGRLSPVMFLLLASLWLRRRSPHKQSA